MALEVWKFVLCNGWEPRVVKSSNKSILADPVREALGGKGANTPSEVAVLVPRYKERTLQGVVVLVLS